MLRACSTLVLLLLATGLYFRTRAPRWHWKIMVTAFVCDVALVLYIEYTLHAVERVVSEVNALIWVHAGISLGVLACYLAMFWLGRSLLHSRMDRRLAHRNVGIAFCCLRGLNYVTSYLV